MANIGGYMGKEILFDYLEDSEEREKLIDYYSKNDLSKPSYKTICARLNDGWGIEEIADYFSVSRKMINRKIHFLKAKGLL